LSNQKDIENKKIETTETDFKARRRLLKASAAAPLIVTLSPNAALAQGSLTCAEKNEADDGLQAAPTMVDGLFASDQAVRRPVALFHHPGAPANGKPDLYFIDGEYYTEDGVPTDPGGYKELPDPVWVVEYFDVLPDGTSCSLGLWPAVQPGFDTTVLSISCEASIGMISSCSIV
jgi:hypothetical protein